MSLVLFSIESELRNQSTTLYKSLFRVSSNENTPTIDSFDNSIRLMTEKLKWTR